MLLAAGEELTTVTKRLGHADEIVVLRTYAHLLPDQQAAATEKAQAILRDAMNSSP